MVSYLLAFLPTRYRQTLEPTNVMVPSVSNRAQITLHVLHVSLRKTKETKDTGNKTTPNKA